jgi:peptide chain release factor 1
MIPKDKVLAVLKQFQELDQKISTVPASDTAQMETLSKERKKMEPTVTASQEWLRLTDEIQSLVEMSKDADVSIAEMARKEQEILLPRLDDVSKRLHKLLNPPDPRADRDSIIEIRAGAGGDEAGLFVADLFRMYTRFAIKKGLEFSVYSSTPTGVGGLKEVVFSISGPNAYGWFRFEQGVHRVQRVPATEAQGRIHTSTVTVAVLPEATEVEVKIELRDLKIDTYRASGAGGQHVNKTDSAVRLTHLPTGIIVACQRERSQIKNKEVAMKVLKAKLYDYEQEKQRAALEKHFDERGQIAWGNQIRSYVFMPYQLVKDLRTDHETGNIEAVMDGEIDPFIKAYLDWKTTKKDATLPR